MSSPEDVKAALAAGVGNIYITKQGVANGALDAVEGRTPEERKQVGVAIDEEGGTVARLSGIIQPALPSAQELGALPPEKITALVAAHAKKMAELGITRDYAPVADVGPSEFLGTRTAADQPDKVLAYTQAFLAGLNNSGISGTLKHFPGHGSTNADTHQTAAETTDLNTLKGKDLVPYKELLSKPDSGTAVMLGHLTVPGLTEPGTVASISPAAVKLIRTGVDYGGKPFNGMLLTDDLSGMKAILNTMTAPQAAVAAVKAGVDSPMVTWSKDGEQVIQALNQANLDQSKVKESVARIAQARGQCTGTPAAVAPVKTDKQPCQTIVHIGDSLGVGQESVEGDDSLQTLYTAAGAKTVKLDMSGGRSMVERVNGQTNGVEAAEAAKASTNPQGRCWVIALGTNDAGNIAAGSTYDAKTRIDKMLAVTGTERVLWPTVFTTAEAKTYWAPQNSEAFNKVLKSEAASHPNVEVLDWAAMADPSQISDGIHGNMAYYKARNVAFANALKVK